MSPTGQSHDVRSKSSSSTNSKTKIISGRMESWGMSGIMSF